MLIIAKIFAAILGLFVIARAISDYRSKRESLTMTVFWILVWGSIITIAFFPSLVDWLIAASGGERTGIGTVFGMAIALVLFVSYRVYVKSNRVEKALVKLSRAIAFDKLKAQQKTKGKK